MIHGTPHGAPPPPPFSVCLLQILEDEYVESTYDLTIAKEFKYRPEK